MSIEAENSERVRQVLERIAVEAEKAESRRILTKQLREALLLFASHSDDNVSASNSVHVGKRRERNVTRTGLEIADKSVFLSDLIIELESISMPADLSKVLPAITQDDWKNGIRIIFLLLRCFEQRDVRHPKYS